MSTSALMPVEFHGATLSLISINNKPYAAVKPVCDGIGLAWSSQYQKIKNDPVLGSTMSIIDIVAEDGKKREMVCLPLDKLSGWLFKVDARRVHPQIREKLIAYQFECYDALNNYWNGKSEQAPQVDINSLVKGIDKSVQVLVSLDIASGKQHVAVLDEHIQIVDTRSQGQIVRFINNLDRTHYPKILDLILHYFKQAEEDYHRVQFDLYQLRAQKNMEV